MVNMQLMNLGMIFGIGKLMVLAFIYLPRMNLCNQRPAWRCSKPADIARHRSEMNRYASSEWDDINLPFVRSARPQKRKNPQIGEPLSAGSGLYWFKNITVAGRSEKFLGKLADMNGRTSL